MPEYLPGPFWIRDEPPAPLRAVDDARLTQYLDDLIPTVAASARVLGPIVDTIGSVNESGLDAEYGSSVDVAGAEVDANAGAADDLTTPALVDAGGTVDTLRDQVLPHLPGPDAPIPIDFTEPPGPPPAGDDDRRPGGDGPPRV